IAAYAEFRARVADEDEALCDARSARDRVVMSAIDCDRRPHLLTRASIDRDEAPIEGPDVDLAVPGGDPPVHEPAAHVHRPLAGHLRVVLPELAAGRDLEGVHLAPGRRDVDHPVDIERCAVLGEVRVVIRVPDESETIDVPRIDLREPAVAL